MDSGPQEFVLVSFLACRMVQKSPEQKDRKQLSSFLAGEDTCAAGQGFLEVSAAASRTEQR